MGGLQPQPPSSYAYVYCVLQSYFYRGAQCLSALYRGVGRMTRGSLAIGARLRQKLIARRLKCDDDDDAAAGCRTSHRIPAISNSKEHYTQPSFHDTARLDLVRFFSLVFDQPVYCYL